MNGRVTLHAGSAAVTNLLRLARNESEATVAFAAVASDGDTRLVAAPPPGAPGALDEETLEELARQLGDDPELPHARVIVRSVQRAEPLTVAAAPIPGLAPSLVAVVGDAHRTFDDRQTDAIHRVATRLARHFDALRELGSPAVPAHTAPPEEAASPGVPDPGHDEPLASRNGDAAAAPGQALPSTQTGEDAAQAGDGLAAVLAGLEPAALAIEGSLSWAYPDALTGLPSVAQFFSRAGRLLASDARETGSFALVLIEVPSEETAPAAARALGGQLRFNDPLARIAGTIFAAGALLVPGTTRGDAVEERLGSAVRGALEWLAPVRTTHVLAEPGDRREADELLRQAMLGLPGRSTGGGGAPWRGAGGSAARLPFPYGELLRDAPGRTEARGAVHGRAGVSRDGTKRRTDCGFLAPMRQRPLVSGSRSHPGRTP